ncbi:MAG TPA: histidine phosphatase family protein [Pyrinomonadaceae bacterium]|nr:histidine phosphatase family protein [Pyrinomonadaceae bacterium]
MRITLPLLIGLSFLTFATVNSSAQEREITFILVRHAEKVDDSADPELSPTGKERAERLVRTIGRYRPGAFYSTDYKRTRDTIAPLAKKRKKEVQIYDPRKPQELIDNILKSGTKRFLISGHSNTVPILANLISKKELFKNLVDSEYSVIWVIKVKRGKVVKFELLDY